MRKNVILSRQSNIIRQTHFLQSGSQHIWLKRGGVMQATTGMISLNGAKNLYVLKYPKVSYVFIPQFGDL